MMTFAVVALVLAADPCAPVARATPDPALAAVYVQVGREEADRGARDAAVVAFVRAAELQPEGGSGDAVRAALCAFDRARPLLDEGRCAEALPLLKVAQQGPDTVAAAQLERACGEGREAALTAWLRFSPREAPGAPRRDTGDRLALELAAEGGYDSNATAESFASPTNAGDGFVAGTGLLAFRPLGGDGPFLLAGGGYRKQLFFPASDLGLATGTVGWELGLGPVRASLDYGLDFLAFGGMPWLLRHRGTLAVGAGFGAARLGLAYSLRHEELWAASARDDTGLRHAGEVAAGVHVGRHFVELAAAVQRASGLTAARSFTEAGAELRESVRSPGGQVGFEAAAGARWRGYDALDPDLQVVRRDAQVDLRLAAEYFFDPSLALYGAADARFAFSSVPELSFARVTASAGLRLRVGLW